MTQHRGSKRRELSPSLPHDEAEIKVHSSRSTSRQFCSILIALALVGGFGFWITKSSTSRVADAPSPKQQATGSADTSEPPQSSFPPSFPALNHMIDTVKARPGHESYVAHLQMLLRHMENCLAGRVADGNMQPIAIVVPFRDGPKAATDVLTRFEQLTIFNEAMVRMVGLFGPFHIYVIEQSDDSRKFNIGKLKNIGYEIATQQGYDIIVLSDVDMLPDCNLAPSYRSYPHHPIHLAARGTRYTNQMRSKRGGETFLGGVCSFSRASFAAANGYPNDYWGWGGDDDELLDRLHDVGIKATVPSVGSILDLEKMSVRQKMDKIKQEDARFMMRNSVRKLHSTTWRTNGLSSLEYQVLRSREFSANCTIITVEL